MLRHQLDWPHAKSVGDFLNCVRLNLTVTVKQIRKITGSDSRPPRQLILADTLLSQNSLDIFLDPFGKFAHVHLPILPQLPVRVHGTRRKVAKSQALRGVPTDIQSVGTPE